MRYASVFIPTLALAFAACADVQNPATPRSATPSLAVSSAASAAAGGPSKIAYSNFGSRLAFDSLPAHAWVMQYPSPDAGGWVISQQFTPSRDFVFGAARVALTAYSAPMLIAVLVHEDYQGLPSRVIDEMWIEALNPVPAVYVATSTRFPALQAGAHYWLTVVPEDIDPQLGWNWNVIGDVSSTNLAAFQDVGWSIIPNQTRGAFQIEARQQTQGPVLHEATGGGTVSYEWEGGVEKLTYAVSARQMADGSAKGEVLFRAHDLRIDLKGTVTCLVVIDNRAYLSGDITRMTPPFNAPHFALALEDNGEGSGATRADRVTVPALYSDGPSYEASDVVFARRLPCVGPAMPFLDWNNGNAQVR